MCCYGGKVTLSNLHNLPQFFCNLLTDDTVAAKQFRKNLLKYNALFIMTSFGADRDCTNRAFLLSYNIQGQCNHRIGPVLPLENDQPKYAQVFSMVGGEQEAIHRCQLYNGVDNNIIVQIQEALHKLPDGIE